MKTLGALLFLTVLCMRPAVAESPIGGGGNFDLFYSSLSPHGQWIECNLGYVWRPMHVSHGWRPYMNGRWVWSDYGWYWVSYEPYGWATYHYGRWFYDDFYGWIWIPDETWGPAWVEWRYDDDYLGWAPLSPYHAFTFSAGVTFTHAWTAPYHYWSFVTYHNFTSERIVDCVQPVERNTRIFGSTRGVLDIRSSDNRIVNHGLDVAIIERRGNIRVRSAEVVDRSGGDGERFSQNGDRDRIEAYRPHLETRLRDQISRPQNAERATRQIATDFNKSPREKQLDRMRSIEGTAPRIFIPRNNANPQGRENRNRPNQLPDPQQGNRPDLRPSPNEHHPDFRRPAQGNRPELQRPGQNQPHNIPPITRPAPRHIPPAPPQENKIKQPERNFERHDARPDNGGQRPRPR
jgi:hypothetical protein